MNSEGEARPAAGGRGIALNGVLNLGTGALILVLNLIFVPLLIRSFGNELYGVLTVTWMVLANLAWLDLGFSRAAARFVAQDLAQGEPDRAAVWGWTAVMTQLALGACGTVAVLLLAPHLVQWLHVQPERQELVVLTLTLFAFAIPIDLAARSMNGVLEAGQRFGWINALSLIINLLIFAVYSVAIWRGGDFLFVIVALFVIRILNLVGTFSGALRVLPALGRMPDVELVLKNYRGHALTMIRFGWWISFASLLGALLLFFDQWIIGFVIGVAMLPFYSVPMNLLGRLSMVPMSLTSTLFPAFSALHRIGGWERIESLYVRAHRYVLAALLPILFVVFVWAGEILRLWIGADFAAEATLPLRILVIGFGIALVGPISGALVEAVGRPDLLAKLYMAEIPVNVLVVLFLTKNFGLAGAAASFALRSVYEMAALWTIIYRKLPFSGRRFLRTGLLPVAALAAGLAVPASLIEARIDSPGALAATMIVLAIYSVFIMRFFLDAQDRDMIRGMAGRLRKVRLPWG